ncbi:MAG: S8 family serine peptidase [Thermodesulfobacteriota bacterium]
MEVAGPQLVYRAFYDDTRPPNDPEYAKQWHFKMIGMEEAWKVTRGKDVIVAVIDTGVAAFDFGRWHQAQDLKPTLFAKGYDFINNDNHPEDDVRHGTHVAATIAESTDNGLLGAGVTPEATILPVKVLRPEGGTTADTAEGIGFAVRQGARVINLSLGGGAYDPNIKKACELAYKAGVTLGCAAGNSAKENGGGWVKYPALFEECSAVSAVDPILGVLGLGVGRWKELGMKASLPQLALPLALGLCAPDVLEFAFGFGSRLNMLGRSVLVPVVWLKLRNQKQAPLRWALAVTVGLVVHLLMDAQSGATPFAVRPQWRVSCRLYANAAVGAGLLFFGFQEADAGKKAVSKPAA